MGTKKQYDIGTEVLKRFIMLVREHGSLNGMTYSFSPRKVQIDDLYNSTGVMIRKNKIFVQGRDNDANGVLERVFSTSESFQRSCNNEYFCDKDMEDLIIEVFKAHSDYISDSLLVGYWEEV